LSDEKRDIPPADLFPLFHLYMKKYLGVTFDNTDENIERFENEVDADMNMEIDK